MSTKVRAIDALAARLRELLPATKAADMVGNRTRLFEDNLLKGLAPSQVTVPHSSEDEEALRSSVEQVIDTAERIRAA